MKNVKLLRPLKNKNIFKLYASWNFSQITNFNESLCIYDKTEFAPNKIYGVDTLENSRDIFSEGAVERGRHYGKTHRVTETNNKIDNTDWNIPNFQYWKFGSSSLYNLDYVLCISRNLNAFIKDYPCANIQNVNTGICTPAAFQSRTGNKFLCIIHPQKYLWDRDQFSTTATEIWPIDLDKIRSFRWSKRS